MELLKKITTKTVMGERPDRPEKAAPQVDLYTVYGVANGVTHGESDYGNWTKLLGTFEAVRIKDGVVFAGGAVFLPEPTNSMISAQLEQTDNDGKRVTNAVEFSVKVCIKRNDTPIGYEYVTQSLVDSGEADPLKALRTATAKALPAPEEVKK